MIEGRGKEYGVVHLVVGESQATEMSGVPAAAALPVTAAASESATAPVDLLTYLERNSINGGQLLLELGAIYVNEVRAEHNFNVQPKDYVRVHTRPRRYKKPDGLLSRIVEKTRDYIIVDKPSGIPVHSQVDNSQENLLKFLEEDLNEPLFVTHRLDIETNGCLLVARNIEARRAINQLFRDRKIKKHYVAVIETAVEPKPYTHFMKPSFKSPRQVSESAADGWLKCELKVISCVKSSLGDNGDQPTPGDREVFEIKIELLTGRPQQIRAQLAALGAPIAGDIKYGSTIALREPNTIMLRCDELIFDSRLQIIGAAKGAIDEGD